MNLGEVHRCFPYSLIRPLSTSRSFAVKNPRGRIAPHLFNVKGRALIRTRPSCLLPISRSFTHHDIRQLHHVAYVHFTIVVHVGVGYHKGARSIAHHVVRYRHHVGNIHLTVVVHVTR